MPNKESRSEVVPSFVIRSADQVEVSCILECLHPNLVPASLETGRSQEPSPKLNLTQSETADS